MHVNPAGETDEVKVTVPVNPLTGATVMVEVPEAPELTLTLEGLAVSVKLVTVKVAVVEWVRAGLVLVPVMVRVYVPAVVELHDTVAVPEPVTVPGVMLPQVSPAGTVSVNETAPAKPPCEVIVIVEVAD